MSMDDDAAEAIKNLNNPDEPQSDIRVKKLYSLPIPSTIQILLQLSPFLGSSEEERDCNCALLRSRRVLFLSVNSSRGLDERGTETKNLTIHLLNRPFPHLSRWIKAY